VSGLRGRTSNQPASATPAAIWTQLAQGELDAYADVNDQDHALLAEEIGQGRIEAITGV
jgi:hypothetical protein